jgi:hypothetical protein
MKSKHEQWIGIALLLCLGLLFLAASGNTGRPWQLIDLVGDEESFEWKDTDGTTIWRMHKDGTFVMIPTNKQLRVAGIEITSASPVDVEDGGTGSSSLTGIVYGNGTAALSAYDPSDNNIPKGSGTGLTASGLNDDGTNIYFTSRNLGGGTSSPDYGFDFETVTGATYGKIKAAYPLYFANNGSTSVGFGFNAYNNPVWKAGAGSAGAYSSALIYDATNGTLYYFATDNLNSSGGTLSNLDTRFYADRNGNFWVGNNLSALSITDRTESPPDATEALRITRTMRPKKLANGGYGIDYSVLDSSLIQEVTREIVRPVLLNKQTGARTPLHLMTNERQAEILNALPADTEIIQVTEAKVDRGRNLTRTVSGFGLILPRLADQAQEQAQDIRQLRRQNRELEERIAALEARQ